MTDDLQATTDRCLERIELERRGAVARAAGLSRLDNPFLRADAMPAITGEPLDEWARKHEAWNFGWQMEDMMQ